MKNLIIIVVIAAVGYFIYANWQTISSKNVINSAINSTTQTRVEQNGETQEAMQYNQ